MVFNISHRGDEGFEVSDDFIGLGSKGLPVPVHLVGDPREALALERLGQDASRLILRVGKLKQKNHP